MAGVASSSPTATSSKYVSSADTALHHQVGLTLLHHLAALVQDLALERDEPAVGLGGLLLGDDAGPQADGVADLDRALELPTEADEGQRSVGLRRAGEEPGLDGQAEQPVGDPLAEDRLLHELGVGVEHIVVARQSGEEHDVRLSHRPTRRLVLFAELDVLEIASGRGHARVGYYSAVVDPARGPMLFSPHPRGHFRVFWR